MIALSNRLACKLTALLLVIVFSLLISCTGDNSANQNASTAQSSTQPANTNSNTEQSQTNDDLSELAQIIRMPDVIPEDVSWREEDTKNPQGKKLTAVFLLNNEDAEKLMASAPKGRPAEKVEIDAVAWFPAELIAQAPLAGDQMLKGTSYPATDFVNAPYGKGRVIRIDNTNYFVLELTTY